MICIITLSDCQIYIYIHMYVCKSPTINFIQTKLRASEQTITKTCIIFRSKLRSEYACTYVCECWCILNIEYTKTYIISVENVHDNDDDGFVD